MEKHRKKIYVCNPFRAKSKEPDVRRMEISANKALARSACKMITNFGFLPIAPHLYFPQFLDDETPEEREIGMRLGLELLQDADELWTFSEQISSGMLAEITEASKHGIPVRMFGTKEDDDFLNDLPGGNLFEEEEHSEERATKEDAKSKEQHIEAIIIRRAGREN